MILPALSNQEPENNTEEKVSTMLQSGEREFVLLQ